MVSKGRDVGCFGGDEFSFAGETFVATDFDFDGQDRTLQIRTASYPGGSIGDLIFLGVKYGKSVAVAEITNIGPVRTLVVKELEGDLFWSKDFVTDLGRGDQKLFVRFRIPLLNLGIQVSLGFNAGDVLANPGPVDSNLILDMDGDNTITDAEADRFVERATALIKRPEGLPLEELVPGIPSDLKVSGVGLSGLSSAEEVTMFNGIAARVKVTDGIPTLYINWIVDAPAGIRVNKWRDIDRIDFDEFIKDFNEINVKPPYPYDPLVDVKQWALPSLYMNLLHKASETVVVKDEKIKSIKRVKKCGKRYYRLELADSRFVPSIKPGKYENCLAFIGVRPVC